MAFLPAAIWLVGVGLPDVPLDGDPAVLELDTRRVAAGDHLVGAYSRFRWHHPGPALFIIYAVTYEIASERASALYLAAWLVATVSGLLLVRLGREVGGSVLEWAMAAVVLAWSLWGGPRLLCDIWNPFVPILPFAAALFCAALVAAGRFRWLPLLAVLGSFVIQCHVGYLPAVGLAVGTALACWRGRSSRGAAGPVAWTALLVLLLWLPPLVDQARSPAGNLGLLAEFLSHSDGRHLYAEAFDVASRQLASVPLDLAQRLVESVSDRGGGGAGLLATALPVLLVAVHGRLRRDKRLPEAYLAMILALEILALPTILVRARGPLHGYLVVWVALLGLLGWGLVATWILEGRGRGGWWLVRWGGITSSAVLAVLVAGASGRALGDAPPLPLEDLGQIRLLADRVANETGSIARLRMTIESHDRWPTVAGIRLQLAKRGVPNTVGPEWEFMFGSSEGRLQQEVEVRVGDLAFHQEMSRRPDARLVVAAGGTWVYRILVPDWPSDQIARFQCDLSAVSQVVGPAQVACDGRVPPPGTAWDSPDSVRLLDESSFLDFRVPEQEVAGIRVIADHNDVYSLFVSQDGVEFEEFGDLRQTAGPGVRERVLMGGLPRQVRYLRLQPKRGDGAYAVAEVEFLAADAVNPLPPRTDRRPVPSPSVRSG